MKSMGDTKEYNYQKLGKFLWSINVKRWELPRALDEYQIKIDEGNLSLIYMGWDEIEEEQHVPA